MLLLPALAAALLSPAFAPVAAAAEPYLPEDWVYTAEPTAPDKFGIDHWGLESFMLPYRVVQRGKHKLESRYADNFRFETRSRGAKVAGGGLRVLSTLVDFALFTGPQNFDHVMGHDARAREFARDYPATYKHISWRFTQVLPAYLGGRELQDDEKVTNFQNTGADFRTLVNSTLWEMRNQYFQHEAMLALQDEQVNSTRVANLILHRLSMIQTDWEGINQVCATAYNVPGTTPFECRGGDGGSARDFSNYLLDLNTGRYGVREVDAYKLTISDLKRANRLQLLDPVFWTALYAYGGDYIVGGKNVTGLPMIPLGGGLAYLPGLRVDLSPFGVEYIQDNYLRFKGTLTDLYWTRGDNKYERRLGAGFDVQRLPLFYGLTAGVFGELYKQPLMSRIEDPSPLSPEEVGRTHNVWNAGASLRVPIRQALLTVKVGRKNTGWAPGEYIKGSTYVETGVGLRL